MQKISVIIPAYNIEEYIERCVLSVTAQTYPSDCLEIIVVDDGSTDQTGSIIDRLASEHANVVALHKPNGGSSSARNLGLSKASGEWVGFVDSDDYVDPHMYETMMAAAVQYHADMIQITRDEIAEDGTRLPDVVIPPKTPVVETSQEHFKTLLLHTGDASYCTKLIRRSLFNQEYQFPVGELNEDFYLMIKMLPLVNQIVILPQQYYHVFYRSGSNSRKKKEQKDYFPPVFTDIVRNADVALKICDDRYPELHEIAMRFGFVQRLDYLLHIPISKMTRDNAFYQEIVSYLRKHRGEVSRNAYLTKKQKIYLQLLMTAPKKVRTIHARIKGFN